MSRQRLAIPIVVQCMSCRAELRLIPGAGVWESPDQWEGFNVGVIAFDGAPGRAEQGGRWNPTYEIIRCGTGTPGAVDAATLLHDFLDCPLSEWKVFIEKIGCFDGRYIDQSSFEHWQKKIKFMALNSRTIRGFGLPPIPLHIDWNSRPPVAKAVYESVPDTLMAHLILEELRGAKWKMCAKEGCPQIFRPGKHGGQKYHDEHCAHAAAQKAYRERKAKAAQRKQRRRG